MAPEDIAGERRQTFGGAQKDLALDRKIAAGAPKR